jgi:hypothetical protein
METERSEMKMMKKDLQKVCGKDSILPVKRIYLLP